jgi:hypothetical protein
VTDGTATESVDVSVLTIGGRELTAFIGANGGSPGQVGFEVGVQEFALAILKPVAADTRSWWRCALLTGRLHGHPRRRDLRRNPGGGDQHRRRRRYVRRLQPAAGRASLGADERLDHARHRLRDTFVRLSADVTIRIAGFFRLSGQFAFERSTLPTVTLDDGSTLTDAAMLAFSIQAPLTATPPPLPGADPVPPAFVGINAGTPTAIGFGANVDSFLLVIVKPGEASDTRSWAAVKADLSSAGIVGLPSVDLTVSDLLVQINTSAADDTFVDFSAFRAASSSSESSGLSLDYDEAFVQVQGTVTLRIADFLRRRRHLDLLEVDARAPR